MRQPPLNAPYFVPVEVLREREIPLFNNLIFIRTNDSIICMNPCLNSANKIWVVLNLSTSLTHRYPNNFSALLVNDSIVIIKDPDWVEVYSIGDFNNVFLNKRYQFFQR
jgi:hypothetical protein